MTQQTIQYKSGYYIHISNNYGTEEISAVYSQSGFGSVSLGIFKGVRSAKIAITKHIKSVQTGANNA